VEKEEKKEKGRKQKELISFPLLAKVEQISSNE